MADVTSAFLENLSSPFGMVLVGSDLYVANTGSLVRFPYESGALQITAPGKRLLDLPAGTRNHHWTKNVLASADGNRLYVTVGSNSNVAENGLEAEQGRAAIWEVDRASGEHRIFASGLRNPNGMAWQPETAALWTVVNERDELGNDLVPDYLTSVREGAFYGWPYSYYGQTVDQRVSPPRPDLVARAVRPDYALGSHVAALGLAWAERTALPAPFQRGMYIGLHGSWNRKPISGYKVVYVPFEGGAPVGEPVELLTGFVNPKARRRGGRSVSRSMPPERCWWQTTSAHRLARVVRGRRPGNARERSDGVHGSGGAGAAAAGVDGDCACRGDGGPALIRGAAAPSPRLANDFSPARQAPRATRARPIRTRLPCRGCRPRCARRRSTAACAAARSTCAAQ